MAIEALKIDFEDLVFEIFFFEYHYNPIYFIIGLGAKL